MVFSSTALGEKYFDPNAIDLKTRSQGIVDLQALGRGRQLPGVYRVDVFINGTYTSARDVTFVAEDGELKPQLSRETLETLGVNTGAFSPFAQHGLDEPLSRLDEYIPQATTRLDLNKLALHISVPQAAMHFSARQAVDPSSWDHGLPALLLNYSASGTRSWQRHSDAQGSHSFVNLAPGLNVGAWRLRNTSTYTANQNSSTVRDVEGNRTRHRNRQSEWRSLGTYAQRDIQRLRGQFTLGESFTPGEVFDSVPFLGAQLASDDNMLPDSLRGYAPVVRGIANSNAQVSIRQNGNVIYETYVAPGPFIIRDLYPTASSGHLSVTVSEADGSERTFVQPFSAVPIMQREGGLHYGLTLGRYRPQTLRARTPEFAQSSLVYGLNNDLTLYGGAQLSNGYRAALLGLGRGLGQWGSVSVDATQAITHWQDGSRYQGQSFRAQYAKDLFATGTTFTLAGYRYSTTGFYDFREAHEAVVRSVGESETYSEAWRSGYHKRSRMQLQISQSLGAYGGLYFNAYQQSYWKTGERERTFGAGYSVTQAGVSYNLSIDATRYPQSRSLRQLAFSVQIPLGKSSHHWTSLGSQADSRGRFQQRAGVNGQLLEDRTLSYSAQRSYDHQPRASVGAVSLSHRGQYGRAHIGHSDSVSGQQVNYGVQGSVVAHPYGITAGHHLGNAMALVRAPGANDLKVLNQTGVRTDAYGHALVPYLTSYRSNRLALDTLSLANDVDIGASVKSLVPTSGALVLAEFKPRVGARALITLNYQGKPVPFGAMATSPTANQDDGLGIVGDAGRVYLTGLLESGAITLKWGRDDRYQCTAKYQLPPSTKDVKRLTVVGTSAVCL